VKLHAFGSAPEMDECPAFGRWFQLWPPEYRVAKGDARRAWKKIRPSGPLVAHMMTALPRQLASERWLAQFWPPNPAAYLRGERWDDFVEDERRVEQRRKCEHNPPCNSPQWHQVLEARERGEV
jgi:hypothetical protein